MADDNETQINLGDEAADEFGRLRGSGLEASFGQRAMGAEDYDRDLAGAFAAQVAAQRGFANEGMRMALAANLLRGWTRDAHPDKWVEVAEKALAAAAIIYPDPKESA